MNLGKTNKRKSASKQAPVTKSRNIKQKHSSSAHARKPNEHKPPHACVYGGIKRLPQVFASDVTPRMANSLSLSSPVFLLLFNNFLLFDEMRLVRRAICIDG